MNPKKRPVEGVNKPVSRVVLGSVMMDSDDLPSSFALLDYYFEYGGNCIDSAWIYRLGNSEKCIGTWIRQRGVREQVVLLGKGGAPIENCTPETVTAQLMESLERLQTDYLDIYLLHRDNPGVPVGEFVDCLNQHHQAGLMHCFGGSNWTIERLAAANEYAKQHGLRGFGASSPNLSLAVWNEPTWTDCVSASDRQSRNWYRDTGLALFAWSSQAAGFFTDRYKEEDADKEGTKEMARVWFNAANFERLRRVKSLANEKNVQPSQVALAYVLTDPANTFALVGPANVEELRQCFDAEDIMLSPVERRWLNLEG